MRTNSRIWLGACVFLVVLATSAVGRTLTVDDDGGANFTKIQDAIDSARPQDQIRVAPGTYNENIDFLNRYDLRLYSSHGPEVTIIDGGGAETVIVCKTPAHVNRLEGFTITGGIFGMRLESTGGIKVANCIFRDNYRGIESSWSDYSVTNCTFTRNSSHGGMYNLGGSPVVKNCTFSDNFGDGGGMFNEDSSPTVTACIFKNNRGFNGGGMYNLFRSSPTVANCIFIGNQGEPIANGYSAGGITNWDGSSPTVTNCTFSGNSGKNAGAMFNMGNCHPVVTNCVLWDNTPNEIRNDGGASSTVTYSNVQGGWPWGTGNINADPLFVNAAGGDLHLVRCSPCADAGNNNAVPAGITTDLAGNARFVDIAGVDDKGAGTPPIVDMGAYERQTDSCEIINVPQEFSTIQAAINASCPGDEIIVAPGTYNEAINFLGKAITLRSTDPNDPNVVAATVLNGNGAYHVVQCVSGEDANTLLAGFTITGGNANGGWPHYYGGGMYCKNNSRPTVTKCTFTGNSADSRGGAMYNSDSWLGNPTVTDCNFSNNSAGEHGGAMYNDGSSPIVTNCVFTGNWADKDGGGMYNDAGCIPTEPTVINCTFIGNSTIQNKEKDIRLKNFVSVYCEYCLTSFIVGHSIVRWFTAFYSVSLR